MVRSLKTKVIAAVKKWLGKWKAKRASVRIKRGRVRQMKRQLVVAERDMRRFESFIASNRDELSQKSLETLGTGDLDFLNEGDESDAFFGYQIRTVRQIQERFLHNVIVQLKG